MGRGSQAFLSPGDLSNPENEPRSLTLQMDSLSSETPGKPKEQRQPKNKNMSMTVPIKLY